MTTTPHVDLSIVVTIVEGGANLERCLTSLVNQQGDYSLEIIVPFDHTSRDAEALIDRFPQVTFMDLGEILGGTIPRDPLALHAFFDTRRSEALKVAKGRLLGILEDRGIPALDWAKVMIEMHAEHSRAVIGGAVVNGEKHLWSWAIFFCDFGRYQPPLSDENPEYVTDTNITYERHALMSVRHLWENQYQEAQVNWALRRDGHTMMLTDKAITKQHRKPIGVLAMARERLGWARMFGQVRGREVSLGQKLRLCMAMPLLPFMLLCRHFRRQLAKGQHVKEFILAAPLTLFLLIVWSLGEFVGYLEAKS